MYICVKPFCCLNLVCRVEVLAESGHVFSYVLWASRLFLYYFFLIIFFAISNIHDTVTDWYSVSATSRMLRIRISIDGGKKMISEH